MMVCAIAFIAAAASIAVNLNGGVQGATLGQSVLAVVHRLGSPSLVQTTDSGQEWRWFDGHGVDLDLLTSDDLVIHRVLVGRPEALEGNAPPLVQPQDLPLIGVALRDATNALSAAGAVHRAATDPAISVWGWQDGFVVLQLSEGRVARVLLLDKVAAAASGYAGSAPPLSAFHAPRLVRQPAVDYPRRAIARGAQGVVVIRLVVTATGGVHDASVLLSSGDPDIDAAELDSMRRASFRPARCNGQPCDAVYLDREEYTLDGP